MPAHATPLATYCKKTNNELFSGLIPCTNSKDVQNGTFCIISREPLIYTDGCSTKDVGFGYNHTFFPACVAHDLCYNSEPQTTGLSRRACDENFHSYLRHLCKTKDNNSKKCLAVAWSYFQVVRVAGKENYNCADEKFDYSESFIEGFDFLENLFL